MVSGIQEEDRGAFQLRFQWGHDPEVMVRYTTLEWTEVAS